MKKLKLIIIILVYFSIGNFLLYSSTSGHAGYFTKKAKHHGIIYSYWLNTSEAYLVGKDLYVKGKKKSSKPRENSDNKTSNIFELYIHDLYLKYDLSKKIKNLKEYNITEIDIKEYERHKDNSLELKVINISEYEKALSNEKLKNNSNVCEFDSFYNDIDKYIFIDADTKKMERRYICLDNNYSKFPYIKTEECRLNCYGLDNRIREVRDDNEYVAFTAKTIICITLDGLTWPFQLVSAILSPVGYMGHR